MSDRDYIAFRSSKGRYDYYRLDITRSDPYDDKRVRSYDRALHRTLSEIFSERRLTRSQMNKLICAPIKKHTEKNSIFKLILEREPGLGKLLQKRNELTLLWIAVLCCYQDSAELLVRSGADVNDLYDLPDVHEQRVDLEKSTVLHALLWMYPSSRNERLIALLVDHGADLKAQDSFDHTVLHLAAKNGRVKVTEMLLEKGADVNAVRCLGDGMTPLHEAASTSEFDELLPLLMKHGADLTATDKCGRNVMYYLAIATTPERKHVNLARVLIEKGVSPREMVDSNHREYINQPIHMAVSTGKHELVKLFLDHGANVNVRDCFDTFPLYTAAPTCEPAMLLTLLKRGANIDMRAFNGYTPLHAITMYSEFCWNDKNTVEKIKILLTAGADMFAEARDGRTPIGIICSKNMDNQNPCIRLVLKTLALKKACLQLSIELKGERFINEFPELWNPYQDCIEEINRIKPTKFINYCTFFELLTKCQCQIAPLMRNREFASEFRLYDLSDFSVYAEDILEAFERAERHYRSMLDQENLINEAVYNTLPYMVVRKVARYALNCEICEMKKIVNASRGILI